MARNARQSRALGCCREATESLTASPAELTTPFERINVWNRPQGPRQFALAQTVAPDPASGPLGRALLEWQLVECAIPVPWESSPSCSASPATVSTSPFVQKSSPANQ